MERRKEVSKGKGNEERKVCSTCGSSTNRFPKDTRYKSCLPCINKSKYAWAKRNPEGRAKSVSEYAKRNRKKRNAENAEYRAKKRKQTPAWYDKELVALIYAECPKGYEVDHIEPIKGTTVSGLHTAANLQYLTEYDNKAKGNKQVSGRHSYRTGPDGIVRRCYI